MIYEILVPLVMVACMGLLWFANRRWPESSRRIREQNRDARAVMHGAAFISNGVEWTVRKRMESERARPSPEGPDETARPAAGGSD